MGILIIILLFLSSVVECQCQCRNDPYRKPIERLSLGFEAKGIEVVVVDTSPAGQRIVPVPYGLAVVSRQGSTSIQKRVHRLNDLSGYMNIQTERQALDFARLAIPVAGYTMLDEPQATVEIVCEDWLPKPASWDDRRTWGSGYYGILSRGDYLAGGFQPPVINKVTGGFVIQRWAFSDYPFAIRKVREFVGYRGRYRRVILKFLRHPPKLSHTRWMIPGRM